MTPAVVQRTVALAAVALVAAIATLAVTRDSADDDPAATGPSQVTVAGGTGWYTALAGSRGAPRDAERTTCRRILTSRSLGVTNAVLPCGAKLYLSYNGVEVLTEVIDNRLVRAGRQFELTEALAQRLGIEGTQQIRWRFARR